MEELSHNRRSSRRLRLRHPHNNYRDRSKTPDPSITVHPGQIIYRMLCHASTMGGVIGNSGSIIKGLERDTGARIQTEPTVSGCPERVINVVGHAAIDRNITLEAENEVSQAQEALFRVFERVLVVEGSRDGVVGCRLLVGVGQIGFVTGGGGNILDKIQQNTGADIRILPADQLPACASASDFEMIQIMGDVLAVKKALLAVSYRLQLHSPADRAQLDITSDALCPNPHSEFLPHCSPSSPSLPSSSVDYTVDHSLSSDVDRIHLEDSSTELEVVFRLLCSNSVVGGVIGKGASIVRALENETGASIRMAAPMAGSKERVAIVSAMENPGMLFSPAQIAVVRVFSRSVEVGVDRGRIPGLGNRQTVVARLLVASNQVDCLSDKGGKVASDLCSVSGVDIKILGGNLIPSCAGEDDQVIQIMGEYENVKSALFQVTGGLRDYLFTSMAFGVAGGRNYTYSAVPDKSPLEKKREINSHSLDSVMGISSNQEMRETQGTDYNGLLNNINGHIAPRLQSLEAKGIDNATDLTDSGRDLVTFSDGFEHKSNESAFLKHKTVEVMVSKTLFGSIYGEDGGNLDRLKQISGAEVIVHDPGPSKNEGKVILIGTLDQTQMAESILQAFILTLQ